jgi:hypothetical protein
MTNWRNAGWRGFLSNRIYLYEVCELCRVFPGAGTPVSYLGLNRYFSDYVCAEIDKGLAQWVRWYDARMKERKKSGKFSTQPVHKTLDEVLGITEALRRSGWENDGRGLTDVSRDYKQAVIAAAKRGEPPPDVEVWMREQASGEAEDEHRVEADF